MHGDATLVSVTGGIGSARAGKKFFVELIKSINAAKLARPQAKQQLLRDEMREHHRLRELGVLSERTIRSEQGADTGRALIRQRLRGWRSVRADSRHAGSTAVSFRLTANRSPPTAVTQLRHIHDRLQRQVIRRPRVSACDARRWTRARRTGRTQMRVSASNGANDGNAAGAERSPSMRCAPRSVVDRGNHSFMSPSTTVGVSSGASATATIELPPLRASLGAAQTEVRRDHAQRLTADVESTSSAPRGSHHE